MGGISGEVPAGEDRSFCAVDKQAAFFGGPFDLDAIVFVHGLGGHYSKIWNRFPEFLASDPDLPKLDIFLWGYDSGLLKRGFRGIEEVSDQLMSELSVRFQRDNALHLVGHS